MFTACMLQETSPDGSPVTAQAITYQGAFELPARVKVQDVSAAYQQGLLTISVAKPEKMDGGKPVSVPVVTEQS
jgi:hypothetical protein